MKPEPSYRVLVRHFTRRFVANDLLAAGDDPHQAIVNIFALLGALSFTIALLWGAQFLLLDTKSFTAAIRLGAWWERLEFLTSLTFLIAALGAALCWDALWPDRRDGFVLGVLPVKPRAVLAARWTACCLASGALLLAVNSFTGLLVPVLDAEMGMGQALLRLGLHWLAQFSAGALAFLLIVAAGSLLALLLPWPQFERAAPVLQLCFMLGALALFLLTPPVSRGSKSPGGAQLWIPSYGLTNLASQAGGVPAPFPAPAGRRFLTLLAASAALCAVCFPLAWHKAQRGAVEGRRAPASGPSLWRRGATRALNAVLLRDPRERAVFWHTARTLSRTRKHRLWLALYGAAGFAWILESLEHLWFGEGYKPAWAIRQTLASLPLDFAVFLLIGLRVLFTIPVELPANWTFRLSGVALRPARRGVRKLLWLAGALPVALAPLPVYAALWGPERALYHAAWCGLWCILLIEFLLRRFLKIPFTCSYIPGSANLKVKLGFWFIIAAALSSLVAVIEMACLGQPRGFFLCAAVLVAVWLWLQRPPESQPLAPRFEESAVAELVLLRLS